MSHSWSDWQRQHGMLFALVTRGEEKMLEGWAEMLALRGWSPVEAFAASEWLSINDPPRSRASHIKALEDCLPAIRNRLAREQAERELPADERVTCMDCRGDGLLIVPERRRVRETGEWRMPDPLGKGHFKTMVVACHCALGRRKQRHDFGDKGILCIGEYEFINPGWQRQLRDYQEYLKVSAGSYEFSRSLDEALGAIKRRRDEARQKERTLDSIYEKGFK